MSNLFPAVAAAVVLATSTHAAPFSNGGFESGGLAPWVCDVSANGDCVVDDEAFFTGEFGVFMFESDGVGTLTQTFDTTAGATYDVVFFLDDETSSGPATFSYALDDDTPVPFAELVPDPFFNEVTDSFVASGPTASIVFAFSTQLRGGSFLVDDVSVTERAAAPAPLHAGAPLLIAGLAGLAVLRRQGRRRLRDGWVRPPAASG